LRSLSEQNKSKCWKYFYNLPASKYYW